jgi:uncharacterized protein
MLDPNVSEGIRLFNEGNYFEAHEALECAWREETDPIRELYRGILQVAVCYLHITRGNYDGAIKMYGRSMKWLAPWPDITLGINVAQLRLDLANVVEEIQKLGQAEMGSFNQSLFRPIGYEQNNSTSRKPRAEKSLKIMCDRCGSLMVGGDCKIICPNCGNRFDCSDLNIHFDEWE